MLIDEKKHILWISDFDTRDHIGGAELTTEALKEILLDDGSFFIESIKPNLITKDTLSQKYDLVIMDSIFTLRTTLIIELLNNNNFITIEYDYQKVSINRHLMDDTNQYLDADNEWANFYKFLWAHENRKFSFFMSYEQMEIHKDKISTAIKNCNLDNFAVISSTFKNSKIELINKLYSNRILRNDVSENYLVFNSNNILKGTEQSVKYCEENNLKYQYFSNMSPNSLLVLMSKSKGIVYMPTMHDTCPRILLEASLLGLEVITNSFSQHRKESLFSNDNREDILNYIQNRKLFFIEIIKSYI